MMDNGRLGVEFSEIPCTVCLITDTYPEVFLTRTIKFCSFCEKSRFEKKYYLNYYSRLPYRKKTTDSQSALKLIDTVPLTILKNFGGAILNIFYLNLLVGGLYFPLQLLHFEVPVDKYSIDMDNSGFYITEDVVDSLVKSRPQEVKSPISAPSDFKVILPEDIRFIR